MSKPRPSGLRFSLRELLALVSAAIIALVGLRYANPWWTAAAIGCVLFAFVGAVIVAALDRASRRASAFGFAVATGVYVMLLMSMPGQVGRTAGTALLNPELDPFDGLLPTSQLLRVHFESVSRHFAVHPQTGSLTPYKSGALNVRQLSRQNLSYVKEVPERTSFMLVGHCLWALLFGYIAAKFALWVYARRMHTQHESATPQSA
jgi:hypothetical protein